MNKWKILASILIAGLAIVLVIELGVNAYGEAKDGTLKAQGETRSAMSSADVIPSGFSYQGVLRESDGPVSGEREMVFGLYANDTCTMGVGDPLTHTVAVSDGFFSVSLSFDQAHFNGQALWLQTEIEGSVIGCQPIQTVPYANGLRPGAIISNSLNAEENLFQVRSGTVSPDEGVVGAKLGRRTSLGYPVGLYGYAYEYGSVGVWGVSDSQFGWGVNGVAQGQESIGVRGIANAFTSTTYGVYGEANSPSGYTGYFEHTASSGGGVGLTAVGPTGAIFTSTGGTTVYASGTGDSPIGDDGVRGTHTGDGVVGESTSTGNLDNGVVGFSAGGYGIYGFSNGTGQYGGYFDDPISVNGGCTGCTMRYVARNTSSSTLQQGDVVRAGGVDDSLAGAQQPVIEVASAESGENVLGVVVGHTEMTMVEPDTDDVQAGAHYGPVGGPATPGDYLVIVVQGMAQVRLDPAAEVRTGDMIQASADGATKAVGTSSFGMVLDKADSDGLAWVLVGFE
jgi:hypothetical protein